MPHSFPLRHPVPFDGKTYTELTLRRPKGRDLIAVEETEGDTRKGFVMLAALADVPLDVILELDVEDLEQLSAKVDEVLGKSPSTGPGDAP